MKAVRSAIVSNEVLYLKITSVESHGISMKAKEGKDMMYMPFRILLSMEPWAAAKKALT